MHQTTHRHRGRVSVVLLQQHLRHLCWGQVQESLLQRKFDACILSRRRHNTSKRAVHACMYHSAARVTSQCASKNACQWT